MALKLKSPQRTLAVHEKCPKWAKGQAVEPVKTRRGSPSLNCGLSIAQYGQPFSIQSTSQHHSCPLQ